MRRLSIVAACAAACGGSAPPPARVVAAERVALRIDPGEAEAVLAMVGAPDPDAAWQRIVATTGYRRLAAREAQMKRTIDPAQFRAHIATLATAERASELRATLARWQTIDLRAIASRIFAYLPAEAKLEATIYPVIKPRENSFVYTDDAGAAIFLYLDPATTTADLDNTIAHELHHIGYQSIGEPPCTAPPATCTARTWIGAFGEGFAMLAAAGGPDAHPRGAAKPELRAHWDRTVVELDDQLHEVEAFLRDVLAGSLDATAARDRAMTFFGLQGPWYTVGWVMAVAVERCAGRAALVEAMRRPWTILALYNAARERCPDLALPGTARWDPELVRALGT
jgi:hypothetical protein